jgi:iron-sulfur cluster repair protein YtfE (RIC family)
MQLILRILASVGGIFLKIPVFHFALFRHNQLKFCCDSSVIIGSLSEKQYTFLSDSRLPGNERS